MFAYDDLVQWFKDRCSDQVSRRNRAWDFGRKHGLEPCVVAWNNVAVRWIDGVFYASIGDALRVRNPRKLLDSDETSADSK